MSYATRRNRRGRRRSSRRSFVRGVAYAKGNLTLVRTVVATMENSDTFGWHVAANMHRHVLDRVKRKACVCDGQASNGSIYEMHFLPLGSWPFWT